MSYLSFYLGGFILWFRWQGKTLWNRFWFFAVCCYAVAFTSLMSCSSMLRHKVYAIDENHHWRFDGAFSVWMLYHSRFFPGTNFAPNKGYHFPFVPHFCFVPKSLRRIPFFERCQLDVLSFVACSHDWTQVRRKIALTVNTHSKQWTMTLWLKCWLIQSHFETWNPMTCWEATNVAEMCLYFPFMVGGS